MKIVQMVRQASATASTYLGKVGQLIVDLGAVAVRVHDGSTPGGNLMMGANNNLSDVANVATSRNNLGLGTAALADSTDFDAAGDAAAVLSTSLQKASNLSDLANDATARTNLDVYSKETVDAAITAVTSAVKVATGTAILSDNTAKTVASVLCEAGKWDLSGMGYHVGDNTLYTQASISLTDNVMDYGIGHYNAKGGQEVNTQTVTLAITPIYYDFAVDTVVYLVMVKSFGNNDCSARIQARRVGAH